MTKVNLPQKKAVETEYVYLPLSVLQPNDGQLEGLPANPRTITDNKYELLKQNITEYPQFLKYNGLKVYPLDDNGESYIIIGGNMRFRALKELGYEEIPCEILDKETTIAELQAYTVIDNNNFGKWDWDMLANEWDTQNLEDWGIDLPIHESEINVDEFFDDLEENTAKEKGDKLTIEIPVDFKDEKEEIKNLVEAAISERYQGIKVK